jgi:hypothetical protein
MSKQMQCIQCLVSLIAIMLVSNKAVGQQACADKLLASDGSTNDSFGIRTAIDGDVAAVAAPYDDNIRGAVYIFRRTGGTWNQEAKLVGSNTNDGSAFGNNISLTDNGSVIAIGAFQHTNHNPDGPPAAGAVFVFRRVGSSWIEEQIIGPPFPPEEIQPNMRFGTSVVLSGNLLVIGAAWWNLPQQDPDPDLVDAGAVWAYRYSGITWTLEQGLLSPAPITREYFGHRVVTDGNRILVGAYQDNVGPGRAYLFISSGQTFAYETTLAAPDGSLDDVFGGSVAMWGNYVAVGAPGDDDLGAQSGSVYLFRNNGGVWGFYTKIVASNGAPSDSFGADVDLYDGVLLVSGYLHDHVQEPDPPKVNAGQAYVYARCNSASGDVWHEMAKFVSDDIEANDQFGYGVAIRGDWMVIGAYGRDEGGAVNRGAAYVYPVDRDGDGLSDRWETTGIDWNSDGTIDYVLNGANRDHKDIYVEADSMVDTGAGINLTMSAAAKASVETEFASAPVKNPDGVDGINIHIDIDDQNVPLAAWPGVWTNFDGVKGTPSSPGTNYGFGTQAERSGTNHEAVLSVKSQAYRYCVFAHSYAGTSSSGLAEGFVGDDFMVTLGRWSPPGGNVEQQAATFMHELGHLLGLHHGGPDDVNYKPNYKSIMSYTWQIRYQLPSWGGTSLQQLYHNSWNLKFSSDELAALDENSLDETVGLGGSSTVWVPFGPQSTGPFHLRIAQMGMPVDWNLDGDALDVGLALDIDDVHGNQGGALAVIRSHDDWENLNLRLCGNDNFIDGTHTPGIISELTYNEFLRMCNYCPGDLDENGIVNIDDLLLVINWWGVCVSDPDPCPGDANFDWLINIDDMLLVINHWGQSCPTGQLQDVGSLQSVQDCMDAATEAELVPHSEEWNNFTEKCIAGLCAAGILPDCD